MIWLISGDLPCINDVTKQPAQAVFGYGADSLKDAQWLPWSLGGQGVENPKGKQNILHNPSKTYY